MKKQVFFILIFVGVMTFSCNKDDDKIDSPEIYGSWTVLQTDSQNHSYNVELRFNTDNSYDWLLLDSVEGHGNSHAKFNLIENKMVITEDADCDQEGEYILIREQNKLAIIEVIDGCEPRAKALEYLWDKK